MKKLLLFGFVALQGAALVAMSEDGKPLEGKALEYFEKICAGADQLKAEVVEGFLKDLSEDEARMLARAKTPEGTALLAFVSQYNNPDLVKLLLAYGADPDAKNVAKHKEVGAVCEEFKRNLQVLAEGCILMMQKCCLEKEETC